MPDLIERSLECSSLFMAAEILESKPERLGYVRIHQQHINRIRAVASRMSIEIEEIRLRREIELEITEPGVRPLDDYLTAASVSGLVDVARGVASSSPLPDSVVLKRYLELDRCL